MNKKELLCKGIISDGFYTGSKYHLTISNPGCERLLGFEITNKYTPVDIYFNGYKETKYRGNVRKTKDVTFQLHFLKEAQDYLDVNSNVGDSFAIYTTDEEGALLFAIAESQWARFINHTNKEIERTNMLPFIVIDLYSGSYSKNYTGHEMYNLERNPVDGKYYGYCPPYDNIGLKKFGANAGETSVEGVTVVYVQKSEGSNNREIIAFCDNATIYAPCKTDADLKRNGTDKTGKRVDISYSICSDNMYDLTKERNKFVIVIKKYNSLMFRAQRFYEGTYPNLDREILAYLKRCRQRQDDYDDVRLNEEVQGDSGVSGAENDLSIGSGYAGERVIRDPAIARSAIKKVGYKCEYDKNHTTFKKKDGTQYMEAHHLIPCTPYNARLYKEMYDANIDCAENIVSLCPTCHRRIHYGSEGEKRKIIKALYEKRKEALKGIGVEITLEELYELYK